MNARIERLVRRAVSRVLSLAGTFFALSAMAAGEPISWFRSM